MPPVWQQSGLEYYEKSGGALASFWWELAPQPTPTYTPWWTATPTATDVPPATPTAIDTPTSAPEATATPSWTPTTIPTETPTITPTATETPSLTVTVVASNGTPTPIAEILEIGQPISFTQIGMSPLLSPKLAIYQMLASDDEWSALLDSLRPPKTARPALRPTTTGRGATPTPTVTATPTATATPTDLPNGRPTQSPGAPPAAAGEVSAPVQPNFSEEVVLVAILGVEQLGQSVDIVDVRLEATDLFVKVRIHSEINRTALSTGGADAVSLSRAALPSLDTLTVHFVDEFYRLIDVAADNR